MKEAIIMTREEYDSLIGRVNYLESCMDVADMDLAYFQNRTNRLWNLLNRPAIEELQKKHDEEYLAWCEEIAEKYEKLDEEEWLTSRARFYNNRVYDFCEENDISEWEAYAHRQYYDGCRFWSDSAIKAEIFAEYTDMEFDRNKTEGWTDLKYRLIPDHSWIMVLARDDALERYKENKEKTGYCAGKYWNLVEGFDDMEQESKCLGNGFHEFFR